MNNKTIRFESRDLKLGVEPVSAGELKVGEVYFSIHYLEQEMLTPVMETLIFAGANLNEGDRERLYFKYSAWDVEYAYVQPADQLNHIFEYEKALENLMHCSIRRAKFSKTKARH